MAIKTYKPYTPSRRTMSNLDSSDITAKPKVRSLLVNFRQKRVETTKVESLLDIKKLALKNYIEL